MSLMQSKSLSISFKKSKERPNLKHNRREGEYPENADPVRQDLNVAMLHGDPRTEYKAVFGEALEEYNNKQKRNDRKIKDYYSHVYNSDGKQKPYEEFIIGLGSREDWENSSIDEFKEGVAIVERMVYAFREKNPNMHFINADVHGDESHPHAHIIAVPVGEGYKRGLSKQVSFSKALEGQGYRRTEFQEWRNDQMAVFENVAKSHGITRKLVGTNGYENQEHFKQAKDDIRGYEDMVLTGLSDSEKALKEREEKLKEREEFAEKKILEAKKSLDDSKEAEEETFKMIDRMRAIFDNLNLSDMVKTGLSRYLETGKSGLAVGKVPNKKPATIEDLMKVVKRSNSDSDIKQAIKQVEEAEDDGIDL